MEAFVGLGPWEWVTRNRGIRGSTREQIHDLAAPFRENLRGIIITRLTSSFHRYIYWKDGVDRLASIEEMLGAR